MAKKEEEGGAITAQEADPAGSGNRIIAEWIEYPDIVETRSIFRHEWKGSLDIDCKDTVWDRKKGYKLDVTDLPAEAVDYLRSQPKEWKVYEES